MMMNGQNHSITDGFAATIPAGTRHNVINTAPREDLKLYSLYNPPEHKDDSVHLTKQDADADDHHHFDGTTSLG
jgi:mannose-6-phosphate isomerase-like protein (cupin superfamily)